MYCQPRGISTSLPRTQRFPSNQASAGMIGASVGVGVGVGVGVTVGVGEGVGVGGSGGGVRLSSQRSRSL